MIKHATLLSTRRRRQCAWHAANRSAFDPARLACSSKWRPPFKPNRTSCWPSPRGGALIWSWPR